MDLSKQKPKRGDKIGSKRLRCQIHGHREPRETAGKALKRPSRVLGIGEPVGINQVTEPSVMKSAICEERTKTWGKKGLRHRSEGGGFAVKCRWRTKEVATLVIYELR